MANANGSPDDDDFTRARTILGSILLAVAGLEALIDTLRPDVTIDPFQFYGLLGAGLLLFGVRGLDRFIKP